MGCGGSKAPKQEAMPVIASNLTTVEEVFAAAASGNANVTGRVMASCLEQNKELIANLQTQKKPIRYLIDHLQSTDVGSVFTLAEINGMLNDTKSFESLFARCDLNNDGNITSTELAKALEEEKELVEAFKKLGKPIVYVMAYLKEHSDSITLEEFRAILHDEDSFEALFAKCDLDADGQLSQDEIATALADNPELVAKMKAANMPVERLLEHLKAKNQEKISLEEFRELIHHELADASTATAEPVVAAEEEKTPAADAEAPAAAVETPAAEAGPVLTDWEKMMASVTADYHARIHALFVKLDGDSDGDLTVTELTKIVGSANTKLGFEAKAFMDWYDGGDATDGQLSVEEFRYYLGDLASANTVIEGGDVSTQKLNLVKILDQYEELVAK